MSSSAWVILSVLLVMAVIVYGLIRVRPRWFRPTLRTPRLRPAPFEPDITRMAEALRRREALEPRVIVGAEACIRYATPEAPRRTPLCYLYLHGLSASRQETAPVTETLAEQDAANAVYARIAGHGMGNRAMGEVDGAAWLESVWEYWLLARELGEQVVIVATSTGAASVIWLLQQPGVIDRVRALLCMAPNFKVRNRLSFLLTWPGADIWLPQVVSPEKRWFSMDPRQERYWSTNYGNQALIQMQLLLDEVKKAPVETFRIPLMIQCAVDDPAIDPGAAHRVFRCWGGQPKRFRWVEVGPGESPHVFVGDIMAPQRNDDVIGAFRDFLDTL